MRCEAALLCSPCCRITFFGFYHFVSPLLNWGIFTVYLVGLLQTLGQSEEGHTPLYSVTWPLGIFFKDSLNSHLFLEQGDFFEAV